MPYRKGCVSYQSYRKMRGENSSLPSFVYDISYLRGNKVETLVPRSFTPFPFIL